MAKKFLFMPPVDESAPPLKAVQWVLLFLSFVVSLAFFWLFMLTVGNHIILAILSIFAFTLTKIPMQMYAMNRKGRIVGRLYIAVLLGFGLYYGWNRIEAQFNQSPFTLLMLIALCWWAYWFTLETAKINQEFLKRMDALQGRVNSVESKLDHIERTIRKTKPESEEIQTG